MFSKNLIEVENLEVIFKTTGGQLKAVSDVSFKMAPGETLGIVGESGCGKSVVSLSIMGLIPNPPGEIKNGNILFGNKNLLKLSQKEMQAIRGNEIAMIFQEPMTSLNPIHTCGNQIMEPLVLHGLMKKKEAIAESIELLSKVGIRNPDQIAKSFPHQLSGGMRQRVMIAMALACSPKLLIADEPTTSLDVTIESQIISLMKQLKQKIGAGIIMISHNLALMSQVCDRIIVMYCGRIVEEGSVTSLLKDPKHPYTIGLIESIPKISENRARLNTIEGTVPNPFFMPKGCSFHPRCSKRIAECEINIPLLKNYKGDRKVRCWNH
jgi:peptide/nickel transport system ATP-binding protein|tara:strand:- start:249 stop:1217 length:969 start_codon:yes stop_codon:yes gene_type:complete